MKKGKTLLLIDSLINLLLGIILLAYSKPVVDLFGLPETDLKFYPNLLGAVLFGIGIALFIEYKRKEEFIGLGLGGAISINLIGGFVLFIWLISGNLILPIHGKIILWILDFILVAISFFELFVYLKNKRPTTTARL
ncbi:MAG: hypothetical protein KAQ62_08450 [Cyclobacteriaceae bacterium]|nr:hypothetical protein [Cyclobacteriaceae bacterium]MCK5368570.1 hypothetical protein [Cyclobacteriaceae bacterium]MCK5467414.1 hypothetical protein [Cyclobacteriaceae bacterium]MCK5700714.1 hypothetical protein [Cyclobacteriaceae bacterium]